MWKWGSGEVGKYASGEIWKWEWDKKVGKWGNDIWKWSLAHLVPACSDDACGKDARQGNGFVYESRQLTFLDIAAFHDDFEPHARFGQFLHCDLQLVNEVLARFRFLCFGIVRCNACGGTKHLIGKTGAISFPYFHNSIFSHFHNSTFKLKVGG